MTASVATFTDLFKSLQFKAKMFHLKEVLYSPLHPLTLAKENDFLDKFHLQV